MTEWILALYLEGSREAVVTATGYKTAEQCLMAGDLMKAADQAAKQVQGRYSVICTEVDKKR